MPPKSKRTLKEALKAPAKAKASKKKGAPKMIKGAAAKVEAQRPKPRPVSAPPRKAPAKAVREEKALMRPAYSAPTGIRSLRSSGNGRIVSAGGVRVYSGALTIPAGTPAAGTVLYNKIIHPRTLSQTDDHLYTETLIFDRWQFSVLEVRLTANQTEYTRTGSICWAAMFDANETLNSGAALVRQLRACTYNGAFTPSEKQVRFFIPIGRCEDRKGFYTDDNGSDDRIISPGRFVIALEAPGNLVAADVVHSMELVFHKMRLSEPKTNTSATLGAFASMLTWIIDEVYDFTYVAGNSLLVKNYTLPAATKVGLLSPLSGPAYTNVDNLALIIPVALPVGTWKLIWTWIWQGDRSMDTDEAFAPALKAGESVDADVSTTLVKRAFPNVGTVTGDWTVSSYVMPTSFDSTQSTHSAVQIVSVNAGAGMENSAVIYFQFPFHPHVEFLSDWKASLNMSLLVLRNDTFEPTKAKKRGISGFDEVRSGVRSFDPLPGMPSAKSKASLGPATREPPRGLRSTTSGPETKSRISAIPKRCPTPEPESKESKDPIPDPLPPATEAALRQSGAFQQPIGPPTSTAAIAAKPYGTGYVKVAADKPSTSGAPRSSSLK